MFDLYIHGTPNGHQIWGSDKNRDYVSTFYNHDTNFSEKAALQIDICRHGSYYTYIHRQNVYDSNDRPGAFFAMTVCFASAYCTNVYKLFELFETVYNRVCIGSIITEKPNKEIYLVSDFESARSDNGLTVERIRNIFIKNIGDLIEPKLLPLNDIADTFNKPKKQISLLEVDSPLFVDFFKKQSIIVLPNLEPAITTNQTLLKQLNVISTQKRSLEASQAQMISDIDFLKKENMSITARCNESVSSSERKYSATINQLKAELIGVKQERDVFKAKLEEVKSSIELIDRPFQKLTRLLAGRFPERYEKNSNDNNLPIGTDSSQCKNQTWYSRINTILLCITLVCVIFILAIILMSNISSNNNNSAEIETAIDTPIANELVDSTEQEGVDESADFGNTPYDKHVTEFADESSCMIDIQGGSLPKVSGEKVVVEGQQYRLSIKTITGKIVPEGTWNVIIDDEPINTKENFIVPQGVSGRNILITYKGEKFKKSRTIKVK